MICTQQTLFGDQVKKNEMGEVHDMYVGQDTCKWSFFEEIDLLDLGIGGKVLYFNIY